MADITAKLIIFRVNETLTNMAEWGLPKFFYTDDTRQHLDVVNMLFVGWILLGIFVYFLGTFIASRLPSRPRSSSSHPLSTADSSDPASNAVNNSKAPNSVDSPVSVGKAAGGGIVKRRQNVGQFGREAVPTGPQYPVSVGADSHSVQWVNDILVWLMSRASVAWLAEGWMSALNDRTIKSSPEHGILVEFDRVLANCPPPELLDIRTDAESNNNVTVNGRVVSRNLGMVITATRNTGRETASVEYELLIEKIDGKIRVACTTEDSLLVIRFVERPDVKLSLKPASGITKFQNLDQRALEDAIVDIIITALASSVVDLHMQHDPDFPKYPKRKPGSESVFTPHNSVPTVARHERRLLVKVIKATNIGGKKGCQEPFCVVEMDDPPQRYQTSSLQDTNSPFWDEHFLFNLKSGSAELLFEIYDRGKKMGENFLGLGIVSVEELLKNPSQRQIISMQSRPMEKDSVTGALTVEFLFMEGSEVPVKGQHGKVETNSRVTPAGTVITTTTIKNTGEDSNDVANTALRELENRGKTSMNTSKSTLIVHSVQREIVRPLVKVKLDKDGKWHEVEQANGEGTDSPSSRSDRGSLFGSSSPTASERNNSERARSKERKSFIGTLRKRLSFKKNRSKSMEQKDDSMPESLSSSRSVSADRSKSVPSSRETSTGRAGGGRLDVPAKMRIKGFRGIKAGSRLDTSSTRSSVSEGSAISGASNRTYINENSTLIIEINENGITKHYLIPYSLATRSKWKKRGVKLHVYNDHTFVAKHVAGSTVCQACTRRFSRRPGKQGYECRECNLQCHKTCHVKVETKCPNSTIHTLEMEYVQDPKAKGKVS